MNITAHSEYGSIHTLFLNHVKDTFVSQKTLNESWEALHFVHKPLFEQAAEEYKAFTDLLKRDISNVAYFSNPGNAGMDAIYCRDASIVTDFGVVLCNMGKNTRSGEPDIHEAFYKAMDIPVLGKIREPGKLEGGDVAWLDTGTLAVGRGYRTNDEGYAQLKSMLEPFGVRLVQVDLPHYKGPNDVFHLMSILSPVDKDLAVVYSPLMSVAFRNELLDRGYELVEVPDSEYDTMGCNVLATAPRNCIMVKGNPITKQRLLDAGCRVSDYEGDHISLAGGGGPTCLTRPVKRYVE